MPTLKSFFKDLALPIPQNETGLTKVFWRRNMHYLCLKGVEVKISDVEEEILLADELQARDNAHISIPDSCGNQSMTLTYIFKGNLKIHNLELEVPGKSELCKESVSIRMFFTTDNHQNTIIINCSVMGVIIAVLISVVVVKMKGRAGRRPREPQRCGRSKTHTEPTSMEWIQHCHRY